MTSTDSKRGLFALMVAHCAGMLDLVALPLWVGTLIAQYKFDPPHAGGLATLFLIGASLASLFFSSRFHRVDARTAAVDPRLLEILVCPVTHSALEYDRAANELISRSARLAFPIRDGVPIMLAEEARAID